MKTRSDIAKLQADPRLGLCVSYRFRKIHETLTHLDDLHEFCAANRFSYEMDEDQTVQIVDRELDNPIDTWWALLHKDGTIQIGFQTDTFRHLEPELKQVLQTVRDANPDFYANQNE